MRNFITIINTAIKKVGVKTILAGLAMAIMAVALFLGIILPEIIKAEPIPKELSEGALNLLQGNTLLAVSDPVGEFKLVQKLKMVITAYSSTIWQTDSTPFTTASGSKVRNGIAANNLLPFGTKIRIPELYGDKIFTVEDRMNARKSDYHLDLWFPEYEQALKFGAKRTFVEILEN